MIYSNQNEVKSDIEKKNMIQKLSKSFRKIFEIMNYDLNDQQIKDTPTRIAKMWINELFKGNYDQEPKITVFDNTSNYDEMIYLGNIQINSTCSHHFVPFIGSAYIAYIPDKKIVGISKFVRIVHWFMRRPQIQEELTKQIADYIEKKLSPLGCAVYIKAKHLCMSIRGVEEYNSNMITSDLRGVFKKEAVKHEFFSMVKI